MRLAASGLCYLMDGKVCSEVMRDFGADFVCVEMSSMCKTSSEGVMLEKQRGSCG